MSWQCHRCNHYTADGQKHECINDEVDELKAELTAAEARIEKLRDTLAKIEEVDRMGYGIHCKLGELAAKALADDDEAKE